MFFSKARNLMKGTKGGALGAFGALVVAAYTSFVNPEMDAETALWLAAGIGTGTGAAFEMFRNVYKQWRTESDKARAIGRGTVSFWTFLGDRVILGNARRMSVLLAVGLSASLVGCVGLTPMPATSGKLKERVTVETSEPTDGVRADGQNLMADTKVSFDVSAPSGTELEGAARVTLRHDDWEMTVDRGGQANTQGLADANVALGAVNAQVVTAIGQVFGAAVQTILQAYLQYVAMQPAEPAEPSQPAPNFQGIPLRLP